ncbi:MAG: hypothetical protein KJO08_04890 [Gammaproteobacteria bacterium]|nr:hypothetical protein [Gammaproteobacteria bacterium]NNJ84228.1 hypothetical protein [Gammaproteobacteria bacterium]
MTFGQNLQVAYTWEAFIEGLKNFSPHVIYFYGSCINGHKTCVAERLRMASGHSYREVSPNELQTAIEKMSEKPVLVYLNALDSAAGLVSFGLALEKLVPAVITSRYLSSADIAREQGMNILIDILARGVLPHRAVATLFGKLDAPRTTADARWITPLLFRRYSEWHARAAPPPARRIHDPYWHLKIDRVTQFSTVATQTMQMVREGRPRCQAFVWYGTKGQGVEKFHHRLNVELREYLVNFNAHLHEVRPDWPSELDDPGIAFRDCLNEAFNVNHLDDIPGAIRGITQGASGRQTLVYVRHTPVHSSRLINPGSLKTYLDWWDREFVPRLERNQFLLLGVSFIVNNPPKFRNLILNKEGLEDLALKGTVFRLLDEMEQLAARDIADFFKTHNIHLPIRNRDRIIEKVLEKTGGHYEKTIDQLQALVEQSWDLHEEEEPAERVREDAYDY